jgi:hypothetical protein
MAKQSSDPGQSVSARASAAPAVASSADLLRWITLLPGVFLVSSSFGVFVGAVAASMLRRPVPMVMELLIPAVGGWTGVLFAYWWAPNRKWPAALATGLLLGVTFWLASLGWAGPWPHRLLSSAVGLAIAAAPWLSQRLIADRQARPGRAPNEEQERAPKPASGFSPQATETPMPAAEMPAASAPAPDWEALRWSLLLPAAAIAYLGALYVAFVPMLLEHAQGERIWLGIALSHVIAGWAALLCGAWIAPARKRSVTYVGYLVFLVLSLPLAGRMLIARGVDTVAAMVGLWFIVAAAVAPVLWVVQRVWGAPARTRP